MRRFVIVSLLVLVLASICFAQDISKVVLDNGDIINAKIVQENKDSITIESDILGRLYIEKKHVKDIVFLGQDGVKEKPQKSAKDSLWKKEISLGLNKVSGNTRSSKTNSSIFLNRKTSTDEFTIKANTLYGSSSNKMDTQKWYTMLRYAFSFKDKRWYNFYKLESDHDRFTNIDYRITPTTGLGYWFSDADNFKAMVELGVGCEHTSFRDNTKNKNEAILIPRAFLEKQLFDKLRFSQELVLYPKLENAGDFRLHSESVVKNYIDENSFIALSFIDDYNSKPDSNTKKNDSRFMTSLNYEF
ncbi:MAG: DUF481 domain-containing protein [Candidatus Gygaella obscura]|nr:DUF481 domain-containing protein [Candidatus Gygaella obscura]